MKEDEIQRLLKRDKDLVSMAATAKKKLTDLEVSHSRKHPIFIFFNLYFNIHIYITLASSEFKTGSMHLIEYMGGGGSSCRQLQSRRIPLGCSMSD